MGSKRISGHCFVHEKDSEPAEQGRLTVGERLKVAMEELARVNRELRCVRNARDEHAAIVTKENKKLREENSRLLRRSCVIKALDAMTADESAAVAVFAEKLLGEGREEYGPLDLKTDPRTVEQLLAEAMDEHMDAFAWTAFALDKLKRSR